MIHQRKRVNHLIHLLFMEIKEQYMRMFQFDYKQANCSKFDFDFVKLD